MPSCLILESIIQNPVCKGDNHHEDPMILFSLTSSRIDLIRASQHLVGYKIVLLIIKVKGNVTDCREYVTCPVCSTQSVRFVKITYGGDG
jgi:hypothetical protein